MGRAKGVVLAFAAPRKAGQTIQLAQTVHAVTPARQDLVRISLMAHVPHQSVVGRVENIVQRHCQFDRAQIRTQVATGTGNAVKHIGAQFIGDARELRARQSPQVGRAVDGFKQLVHLFKSCDGLVAAVGQKPRLTSMSASACKAAVLLSPPARRLACDCESSSCA